MIEMLRLKNAANFFQTIFSFLLSRKIMSMHNLIECIDNYSETSGSLWQYYKDETNNNQADSESFKSKKKIKRKYSC